MISRKNGSQIFCLCFERKDMCIGKRGCYASFSNPRVISIVKVNFGRNNLIYPITDNGNRVKDNCYENIQSMSNNVWVIFESLSHCLNLRDIDEFPPFKQRKDCRILMPCQMFFALIVLNCKVLDKTNTTQSLNISLYPVFHH